MFCPQCGAEYRDEIAECADCGVALVEKSPDFEPRFVDLVTVYEDRDPGKVAIAESVLRAAGIECVVQGESGGALLAVALKMQVQVERADEDAANQLLAELEVPTAAEDAPGDDETTDEA